MQFTANQSDLSKALRLINSAVPKAGDLSQKVGLSLNGEGVLVVSAYNRSLAIASKIQVQKKKGGAIAIPYGDVSNLIYRLPENEEVTISAEAKNRLSIKSGKSQYSFAWSNHEELIDLPRMQHFDSVTLDSEQFINALNDVSSFASVDEYKHILCGVNIRFHKESIDFCATDTYSMAVSKLTLDSELKEQEITLTASHLRDLQRLAGIELEGKLGEISIFFSNNLIEFKIGNTRLTSPILADPYPKYEQLTPNSFSGCFVCERRDLIAALERLELAGSSGTVRHSGAKIVFTNTVANLLLNAENSEKLGIEEISCTIDDTFPDKLNLSSKYLIHILKQIKAPLIRISANSGNSIVSLEGYGMDSNSTFFVMPIG